MEEYDFLGWRFFVSEQRTYDREKDGKWMYFFEDAEGRQFAELRCKEAVEQGIVQEAKRSDSEEGVACFFLNIDDVERHKKVLQFFLDNNMIPKMKNGKYKNISFKLNSQTRAGKYGDDFVPVLKLENFINLWTGEWLES